ncbi:hypothetical protein VOLCADRAFT_96144 [Volvox carteri f. nagariensis]|uniref:Uncharacterized protein n=1 Tax=Volvox carteri f. nagariensis TaxID=3068 RepID=D8U9B7_VOLCA|nr:uncharacterized protein VOLCADRAFT_96144 [Volvox carteri f. nagariensis]EFJ43726.1 hypothetical protein VOLCADRAFT_96144 [Volvox carteri f. nagariensis]|eukprot:XP_002955207.1 hypothetical protein VOLCADRAFT_96144 [Volvox carteri f. nagariensis]
MIKFHLFDKTFGPHVPVTKPFADTFAALSALDPAPYSVPELSTATSSGANFSPVTAATATIQPVTSLPGCAGRPSTDLSNTGPQDAQPVRAVENCTAVCCQPDLQPLGDVGRSRVGASCIAAVAEAEAPLAVAAAMGPGITRHPQLKPQQPRAQRQSLHDDRDASRQRRSFRPSIDAAASATMLYTCPAAEAESTACAQGSQLAAAAAAAVACEMPGCVPPPAPLPFAQMSTPPPPAPPRPAAAATAGHADEWNFGDNLQRARMLARYAAMEAAEEMRYDPGPGVTVTADFSTDGDGGGDGSPSRRSRGALKLLSSLLSGSRGAARAAAALGLVPRCQEAATASRGRRYCSSGGGDDCCQLHYLEEEDLAAPVVARSRDSRRLLRVQRSRVGIDREGESQGGLKTLQKQKQTGRTSAPAFTDEYQQHYKKHQTQQQKKQQLLRQLQARSSAPPVAMLQPDGGSVDEELNAAILAAAAAFAAATAAERLSA